MSKKTVDILKAYGSQLLLWGICFSDFLDHPAGLLGVTLATAAFGTLAIYLKSRSRKRLFTPIDDSRLPRNYRKFVESQTPVMQREGLTKIGDFLIYPEPVALRSRSFINHDGSSFGYIAFRPGCRVCGFFSAFEDGTYLETSPLKPPRKLPAPESPLRFSYFPNASLPDLYAHHQSEIARIETLRGTRVMHFTAEQYPEVDDYGHRLAEWDLYEKGLRSTPPERGNRPVKAQVESFQVEDEPELVASGSGR